MSVLSVQPVDPDSVLPTYSAKDNYTLYSNVDTVLRPHERQCLKAGFRVAFPPSHCALIVKHRDFHQNVRILGGLVDSDFRGEIMVIATSSVEKAVKRGDAVATMLVIEVATPEIENTTVYLDSESDDK